VIRRPRALFDAQSARTPGHLRLDEIAAPKQSGEAWGEVFRLMKAQGLVADKNLGQAVSRFNEVHRRELDQSPIGRPVDID